MSARAQTKAWIGAVLSSLVLTGAAQDAPPPTHDVSPDGSGAACTTEQPCAWGTLLDKLNAGQLPAGSLVRVRAGYHSASARTILRGGVRIVGEPGAILTGTREELPETAWTAVPETRHTYQAALPTTYTVGHVAQRLPATWTPLLVDDRVAPFTVSQGRPFRLTFPPHFKRVASVAQVEAQAGTFATLDGRVYVHTYRDAPPTAADRLYLAPFDWGRLAIEGDGLTLENLAFESILTTALHVRPAADGTVLRRITARSAQVWLEGTRTVAEDLDVSHVIVQGDPSPACYDANPDLAVGECWNHSATGYALLVGRQNVGRSYGQAVRRATVTRGWNGARIDGAQSIEDSTIYGFANHAFQGSGTGGVFRGNTVVNAQDAIYYEGMAFDALTVERNTLIHATLFWVNRDGRPVAPAPARWVFRQNIVPAIGLDDRTALHAEIDCNVYIPRSATPSHVVKVTHTGGGATLTYRTLAHLTSATSFDHRSVMLPHTFWTEGRAFRHFTTLTDAFDLTDPLRVCGARAGA